MKLHMLPFTYRAQLSNFRFEYITQNNYRSQKVERNSGIVEKKILHRVLYQYMLLGKEKCEKLDRDFNWGESYTEGKREK